MKLFKKLGLVLCGGLLLLNSGLASALSSSELQSIYNDTVWYQTSGAVSGCGSAGGVSGTGSNQSPTDSLKAFVDSYGQMAYNDAIKTGVPWEFTLAQAIEESNYGQSQLSSKYSNFFGIKADSSWTGQTVQLPTTENVNGQNIDTIGTFRVYSSPQDSFTDHSNFLRTNSNYASAFQYSNDPIKFANAVAAGGYATDPSYAQKLDVLIQEIIDYNAQTKALTPSSQIKFNVPPPGTSTGSVTSGSCSSSGFTNPFPDGWTPGRLDMGYDGFFKSRIVSPCDGTMVYVNPDSDHSSNGGWEGAFMTVQCPAAISGLPSNAFFFAEGLAPTVSQGQTVTAGQQIAVPGWTGYSEGPGGIEWGLADPSDLGNALALRSQQGCPSNGAHRSMVLDFAQWVEQNLNLASPSSTDQAGCA